MLLFFQFQRGSNGSEAIRRTRAIRPTRATWRRWTTTAPRLRNAAPTAAAPLDQRGERGWDGKVGNLVGKYMEILIHPAIQG